MLTALLAVATLATAMIAVALWVLLARARRRQPEKDRTDVILEHYPFKVHLLTRPEQLPPLVARAVAAGWDVSHLDILAESANALDAMVDAAFAQRLPTGHWLRRRVRRQRGTTEPETNRPGTLVIARDDLFIHGHGRLGALLQKVRAAGMFVVVPTTRTLPEFDADVIAATFTTWDSPRTWDNDSIRALIAAVRHGPMPPPPPPPPVALVTQE